jgi:phenylacetate-CoA ligase
MAERLWAERRPTPDGKVDELVLTDLDNCGFPFLRYRTEDIVTRPRSGACPCGRSLPDLGAVEGRVYDLIQGVNGNVVGGTFFSILLRATVNGLQQYQVIQEQRDVYRLRLNVDQPVQPAARAQVEKRIQDELGPSRTIWEFVDDIPTLPSGKHRFIVAAPLDEGAL